MSESGSTGRNNAESPDERHSFWQGPGAKKVRRDRSGHLGRLHRVDEKKYDRAVFPARVSQMLFVDDDVVSRCLCALKELGRKIASMSKHSFHLYSPVTDFITSVPNEMTI